eukprot:CAMPEP_0174851128 /NCGR_PEP_ID=MMETSP1114-20130205/21777_1 /TAXON_ID=312471 /ORGANISM="Neobodo designis, Strain CCAP 1951/1" /LENGTH=251 /DNA_ID=CAMNT_0016085641 /DNA_START=75 /DNA_END=830 /DNA_ORIENTATION=+
MTGLASSKRHLTPAEDLKKLYESDFEKSSFPTAVVPSESSVFAQFLYKAGESKNNFDAILKDFETVDAATKKLPVFWERTVDVETTPEFKSLTPATIFTMKWMQANGMLGDLANVRATFETFVNAKKNRVVAKIYIPGPEKDHAAAVKDAKEAAKKIHAAAQSKASLDFAIVQDKEFASGWAVECMNKFHSTAKGHHDDSGSAQAADVDYTNLPAHAPIKTVWNDNVETEVLRKYIDQLAKFDLEEQVNGV